MSVIDKMAGSGEVLDGKDAGHPLLGECIAIPYKGQHSLVFFPGCNLIMVGDECGGGSSSSTANRSSNNDGHHSTIM